VFVTPTAARTRRRGWVVNIPASYSGDPVFRSRPGDRLFLRRYFVFFLSSPGKCRDSISNMAMTDSFKIVSNSVFTYHTFSRWFIVWVTEKSRRFVWNSGRRPCHWRWPGFQIFNPITSTIPKWRAFGLLRWMPGLEPDKVGPWYVVCW
jgi:hypothetical protein